MKLNCILFCAFYLLTQTTFAQNQFQELSRLMTENKPIKSVAFQSDGSGIVLFGKNDFAYNGNIPEALTDQMMTFINDDMEVEEVILTEQGRWMLLIDGGQGYISDGLHNDPEQAYQVMFEWLNKFIDNGEVLVSVAFDDEGGWMVVTDKNFICSNVELMNKVSANFQTLGFPRGLAMCDGFQVVLHHYGYAMYGDNVNFEKLAYSLTNTKLDYWRIKVTPSGKYLYMDNEGSFIKNF